MDFTYKPLSFKAITLSGDGMTPLMICKNNKHPNGQGYRGGTTGHHKAKLLCAANCGKYRNCFECGEPECTWK